MTTARCRNDIAMQAEVDIDSRVASAVTLCRLESWTDRQTAWGLHDVLVEQFIVSFPSPPQELILDFDATNSPLHGRQEQFFFYGSYCYLPLYFFC